MLSHITGILWNMKKLTIEIILSVLERVNLRMKTHRVFLWNNEKNQILKPANWFINILIFKNDGHFTKYLFPRFFFLFFFFFLSQKKRMTHGEGRQGEWNRAKEKVNVTHVQLFSTVLHRITFLLFLLNESKFIFT